MSDFCCVVLCVFLAPSTALHPTNVIDSFNLNRTCIKWEGGLNKFKFGFEAVVFFPEVYLRIPCDGKGLYALVTMF